MDMGKIARMYQAFIWRLVRSPIVKKYLESDEVRVCRFDWMHWLVALLRREWVGWDVKGCIAPPVT
jgi:hypothetical protein